jgi:hypothetical protein
MGVLPCDVTTESSLDELLAKVDSLMYQNKKSKAAAGPEEVISRPNFPGRLMPISRRAGLFRRAPTTNYRHALCLKVLDNKKHKRIVNLSAAHCVEARRNRIADNQPERK